jgi:hypothetical protein
MCFLRSAGGGDVPWARKARFRCDPFILRAHPPARLVDKHQPGLVYKAFALLHHHLSILIEEGVHPAAVWRRLDRAKGKY